MSRRVSYLAAAALALALALALVLGTSRAHAQVAPDHEIGGEPNEWNYIFPLFGDRVAARGVDLPMPAGVSIQYNFVRQDILLDNLRIGFNDSPMFDADFVEFERIRADVNALTARFDLWLFPFLDVYAIVGMPWSTTYTSVATPPVESVVDQNGASVGVGAVLAYGVSNVFFTLDQNFIWNFFPDTLDSATFSYVMGLRAGYSFPLRRQSNFSLWAGTMMLMVQGADSGSIRIGDAVDGSGMAGDRLEDAIDGLPPPLQDPVRDAVDQIRGTLEDTVVRYSFDKDLATRWNLVIGAQYTLNERWAFRGEAGLIGRWSAMLSTAYRFGVPGRKRRRAASSP